MAGKDIEKLTERCRMNKRRYWALERCLTLAEGLRRMFSSNQNAMTAEKGCDKEFDAMSETVETLREMLRELRSAIEADAKELDWKV